MEANDGGPLQQIDDGERTGQPEPGACKLQATVSLAHVLPVGSLRGGGFGQASDEPIAVAGRSYGGGEGGEQNEPHSPLARDDIARDFRWRCLGGGQGGQ